MHLRNAVINGKIAPLRPQAITGRGDSRGMVRVRQAGAEVAATFWAKLAGSRTAAGDHQPQLRIVLLALPQNAIILDLRSRKIPA